MPIRSIKAAMNARMFSASDTKASKLIELLEIGKQTNRDIFDLQTYAIMRNSSSSQKYVVPEIPAV